MLDPTVDRPLRIVRRPGEPRRRCAVKIDEPMRRERLADLCDRAERRVALFVRRAG